MSTMTHERIRKLEMEPDLACEADVQELCRLARDALAPPGEVGDIVGGRLRDGEVHLTIAFPDSGRLPGVGAKVRMAREGKAP